MRPFFRGFSRSSRRRRRHHPGFDAAVLDFHDQEGVLIDNFKLVEAGALRETALLDVLRRGPYPARNPSQNLADLRAQIAANEKGVQELEHMVEQYGGETVARYMRFVQDNAEECVRRAITSLTDGEFTLPLG